MFRHSSFGWVLTMQRHQLTHPGLCGQYPFIEINLYNKKTGFKQALLLLRGLAMLMKLEGFRMVTDMATDIMSDIHLDYSVFDMYYITQVHRVFPAYSMSVCLSRYWILWELPYEGATWNMFMQWIALPTCFPFPLKKIKGKRKKKIEWKFCIVSDMNSIFVLACSGNIRKPHETMRLTLAAVAGVVFGFFLGVSFPTLSLTKVRNLSSYH